MSIPLPSSDASCVARQLATWALSLDLRELDAGFLEQVKLHFLDQIGAQVSCRNLATPVIAQQYVARFSLAGPASVLGTRLRLDAEAAGFANATAGSSFEIDDYGGNGAYAHPGCVVVPGALAVAEECGATGAQLLRAVAAGFETVIRLALATMPSLLLERGFHQTGAHGVFAVALASSVIAGDDVETAVNALSIAGSHASGTTEYAQTGGEVKRVHAGIGVAGGIRAGRLARMGLTAPPTIFEGKRGFLQAFCNAYDARYLHEDLGSRWHFSERAAIKPYASCGLVHHHFAAYDKLRAAHAFLPSEIEEVVLGCEPLIIVHNGAAGPRPTDIVGAQFSAEYGMAMRIVKGRNDVGAYLDAQAQGFKDAAVTALADRVRLEADAQCGERIPMGRVTLRLRDGTTLSGTGYALGSPFNPLSRTDIERKYCDLVSRDFGESVAQRTRDLIMDIENLTDLGELTRSFEAVR
ncbi:MAG TPA: MmgE/PrpD family protein [Ramlibacter sp.]|nr:MmgE/PrpD family protein [Ramlibacter sp.]